MTKNPVINALSASLYILGIVSFLQIVSTTLKNKPDTFFAPVAFLSLLTLSAAVMVYLFFYQPVLFLLDGKKKQALQLFIRTVGVFAILTSMVWVLLLAGIL